MKKFCSQVRKRRPETRLNLQYDKLYVNNVAYVVNDDTEEVEMLNQPEGETDCQVGNQTLFFTLFFKNQ